MRKLHMLGLALFAVFAFSVVAVASASALESVWLVNGHTALALELVLSEGERGANGDQNPRHDEERQASHVDRQG